MDGGSRQDWSEATSATKPVMLDYMYLLNVFRLWVYDTYSGCARR